MEREKYLRQREIQEFLKSRLREKLELREKYECSKRLS